MPPLTDAHIRERLAQFRQQVVNDQANVDRWTAEKTYWDGKLTAVTAEGAAAPEDLTDYIAKVDGFIENTRGHLAASTAQRDELIAVMAAGNVSEEAPADV